MPADAELRPDWWKLYDDPVLTKLIEQALAANPDLQAAAERFVQARYAMMKARSQYIPQLGIGLGASNNQISNEKLFRPESIPRVQQGPWSLEGSHPGSLISGRHSAMRLGLRSTAPKSVPPTMGSRASACKRRLRRIISRYAATTRKRRSIANRSISTNSRSTSSRRQFAGKIASALDVARVESLLFSTETKLAQIQGQRQVTEQAIAILLNMMPGGFTIEPVDDIRMVTFTIPETIPSTLLERRPDIAGMERRMAEANRAIGIARAAFFPNVSFRLGGGYEDDGFDLFKLVNSFWSYGSAVSMPVFQGGYRRAQLQQSWSAYRETEDLYRSMVLNAFREVENNLSLTNRLTVAVNRQEATVGATLKTQNMTMELYRGGLASSLELIFAQLNTLYGTHRSRCHQGRPAQVLCCSHPCARRRVEPEAIAQ